MNQRDIEWFDALAAEIGDVEQYVRNGMSRGKVKGGLSEEQAWTVVRKLMALRRTMASWNAADRRHRLGPHR